MLSSFNTVSKLRTLAKASKSIKLIQNRHIVSNELNKKLNMDFKSIAVGGVASIIACYLYSVAKEETKAKPYLPPAK